MRVDGPIETAELQTDRDRIAVTAGAGGAGRRGSSMRRPMAVTRSHRGKHGGGATRGDGVHQVGRLFSFLRCGCGRHGEIDECVPIMESFVRLLFNTCQQTFVNYMQSVRLMFCIFPCNSK